jgi:hypothetical protein
VLRRVAAAFVTGPAAFFIAGLIDVAALALQTIREHTRTRFGLRRGYGG